MAKEGELRHYLLKTSFSRERNKGRVAAERDELGRYLLNDTQKRAYHSLENATVLPAQVEPVERPVGDAPPLPPFLVDKRFHLLPRSAQGHFVKDKFPNLKKKFSEEELGKLLDLAKKQFGKELRFRTKKFAGPALEAPESQRGFPSPEEQKRRTNELYATLQFQRAGGKPEDLEPARFEITAQKGAPLSYLPQLRAPNWEPKDFIRMLPFVYGITNWWKGRKDRKLKNKLLRGEELSEEDEERLRKVQREHWASRLQEKTWTQSTGEGLADLLRWGAEFYLSGAAIKGVAQKAGLGILAKGAKGLPLRAAARTPFQTAKIVNEYGKKTDPKIYIGPNNQLHAKEWKGSRVAAAAEAWLETYKELATEELGGLVTLSGITGKLGKISPKAGGVFGKIAKEVGLGRTRGILARAGLHGMVAEMGEEQVARFAQSLIDVGFGPLTEDKRSVAAKLWSSIPSLKQLRNEASIFAVPTLLGAGGGAVERSRMKAGVRDLLLDRQGSKYFALRNKTVVENWLEEEEPRINSLLETDIGATEEQENRIRENLGNAVDYLDEEIAEQRRKLREVSNEEDIDNKKEEDVQESELEYVENAASLEKGSKVVVKREGRYTKGTLVRKAKGEGASHLVETEEGDRVSTTRLFQFKKEGRRRNPTNDQKAKAHIVKKERGLSDEEYRDIAERTTGKRSMADMNRSEASHFLDALGIPDITPSAREAANRRGVDWTKVKGTGKNGRITKEDVRRHRTEEREKELEEDINALNEQLGMEQEEGKPVVPENLPWWRRLGRKVKNYLTYQRRWNHALRGLDGHEETGPFQEKILRPLNAAAEDLTRMNQRIIEQIEAKLEELRITESDLGNQRHIELDETEGPWTVNQMLEVYLASKDQGKLGHLLEYHNLSERDISTIVNALTDTERAFGDWLQEQYAGYYEDIQEVYGRKTGNLLPQIDGYSHITTEDLGVYLQDELEGELLARGDPSDVGLSATKERVGSGSRLRLDALGNFRRFSRKANRYTAFAEPHRKVRELITSPRFVKAFKKSDRLDAGKRAYKGLLNWVDDSAGLSGNPVLDATDQTISQLRRNLGTAYIGFNLASAMRQPLSWFVGLAESPTYGKYAVPNIAKLMTGGYKDMRGFAYERSGMLETRYPEVTLREIAQRIGLGKERFATLKKAGMAPIRSMDRLTAATIWKTGYDYYLGENPDNIENGEDLEEAAIQHADELIARTQPMSRKVDIPEPWRGGSLARMMVMFGNQTNQNVNQWIDFFQKVGMGKVSKGEAAWFVLMHQVIPSLVLGMTFRGEPPDDWGELAIDTASYPLHGLFAAGPVLTAAMRGWEASPSPVISTGGDVGESITRLVQGNQNWFDVYNAGRALAAVTGVPFSQPYRTAKGIKRLLEGETSDVRELLWSKGALSEEEE